MQAAACAASSQVALAAGYAHLAELPVAADPPAVPILKKSCIQEGERSSLGKHGNLYISLFNHQARTQ